MRAVVSLVARYRSPTTFEYANESCSDVSVGGMFIKSAAPAPAGTLLKLECEPDSGNTDAKIRGVARVVWLRRETNEHGPSGMGVKFVKLEAGSRELIEALVERLAEAGVEARSVSAAPEHRLAAAGGVASVISAEPAPTASPVKLVPSTPPDAVESGAAAEPAAAPAVEKIAAKVEIAAKATSPAAEAPKAAAAIADVAPLVEESRSAIGATGSSRPPKPQPSKFGWKIWVGAIVVLLIAIAIADRRGLGPEKTEVTPEAPAAEPTPKVPEPAPEPKTPSAAAPKPSEPEPAPPKAVVAEPSAAEPAAAEPKAAAEPAAAEPKAAAAAGAETEAPSGPLFPSVAGQPDHIVDFVSQPNGSTVTIDEKATVVTPATVNLGAMPDRIKVTAKKAGFKSSSIWMKRELFELKQGVLRRRAYITLKAEPGTAQ